MKKILFSALVLFLCFKGVAQSIDLSTPLPEDQTIKKGVLPNGMTYYIKSTAVVKDAASYYIIQNVGSVLEQDNQQGLAHFLEHMAFNGTENFEGKGILNTLQKHGAVFGKDINAYTAFDETVYNMNNIPTTPELIDTCLLVLHDWSDNLLLTDEEIDAERGVIKEEWRTRQNGNMRILEQKLPVMYNNTIYAQRMPIGLMDVVENFDYKALRDFYHDWYRTDLQAIAVIGDVNVDEVEAKIKALFAPIKAIENPLKRENIFIPNNKEMLYTMAMDDEVTTAQINFGIRHAKSLENETVADLKKSLEISLITSMLSSRMRELTQNPDAPFLGVRISYGGNSRTSNALNVNVYPKPNMQHEAFKVVMEEINRAVKFGFTEEEIARTITSYKNSYENQIAKKNDRSHKSIENSMQRNYLENSTMTDIEKEYEIAEQLFEGFTVSEIHKQLQALYTQDNRFLMVTGVKDNNNLTEADALKIIEDAENNKVLEAYTDGFSGKTLISDLTITPGKIVSEKTNSAVGSKTFTLSNGIIVHYKFVDKNKNDVKLYATSYGGYSLIEDKDLASASFVKSLVTQSGLGNYSSTDLTKVLAGKSATTGISISELEESVVGSSVTKDVETMLQMTYLRFVQPRFDEDAFKVLQGNVDNYLIRRSNDLGEKIGDSIKVTIYGDNNAKHPIFTQAYANQISFDKIKEIYSSRFANAADFEFFIIGDVNEATIKPLLEKYIASIPTTKVKENWKDTNDNWVSNNIDKDVYIKMENPKSSVRISYKNDFKYSLKNAYIAKALGDMLTLRFTETLREQEGGTYGASARASLSKRPKQEAAISIAFDCNPDKVEQLVAIVHQELNKIAAGDISQVDLDKTKTNFLKSHEQQKGYNKYDQNVIVNYFREGYNMNDPKNFEDIVKQLSVKDIQEFTSKLLKNAKTYEIIIKPLN